MEQRNSIVNLLNENGLALSLDSNGEIQRTMRDIELRQISTVLQFADDHRQEILQELHAEKYRLLVLERFNSLRNLVNRQPTIDTVTGARIFLASVEAKIGSFRRMLDKFVLRGQQNDRHAD